MRARASGTSHRSIATNSTGTRRGQSAVKGWCVAGGGEGQRSSSGGDEAPGRTRLNDPRSTSHGKQQRCARGVLFDISPFHGINMPPVQLRLQSYDVYVFVPFRLPSATRKDAEEKPRQRQHFRGDGEKAGQACVSISAPGLPVPLLWLTECFFSSIWPPAAASNDQ